MRNVKGRIFLTALLSLALALPAAADDGDVSTVYEAWQGQGQGQGRGNGGGNDDTRGNQGRGNEDRATQGNQGRGQGNQGRDDDDRGNARGNQGRDDEDRGNARGNQGRGNDDRGNAQGNQARGNSGNARGNSGNAGDDDNRSAARARRDRPDFVRLRSEIDRLPANLRTMASSSRRGDRIVAGAIARASLRGTNADRFRVDSDGSRWSVKNSRNEVLLDMDEDDARGLGAWRMRRLGDQRPNENAPAFCRSGAGHPVHGREWCIEKGFGLGVSDRSIWSRATDIGSIRISKRPTTEMVDRGGLLDILGDVVFGRLAVQSLVLGNDEPLVGRWVASDEPDSPFILRVTAGDVAVAELVDTDRDDDVDVLFVSQPRW